MTYSPLLAVYGLNFQFSNIATPVLQEVSFKIEKGEFIVLIGPNGSGKSTLLKIISGIIPLGRIPNQKNNNSGQIRFRGEDLLSLSSFKRAQNVVYVGSELRPDFPLTVLETVSMSRVCQNHGLLYQISDADQQKIEKAMKMCLCWDLRDRRLETLSDGQRQLVALAGAIAQGAKVLLLDESLSKMDLNHRAVIGKTLKSLTKEQGMSVILVSHDINSALEWADSAMILNQGKLIAYGKLKNVINSAYLEQLYPGSQWQISTHPITGAPHVFHTAAGEKG